jgi:serine/threonine protein phosphatase PrpC
MVSSTALWTALGASVRGASHESHGQKNQDSVRLKNPLGVNDFLLLAVADGHGSARSFRSERGSALAAECALRVLGDMVRKLGRDAPLSRVRRQAMTRWPQRIVRAWRSAVRDDLRANPFSLLEFAAFPEKPPVVKPGEELPGTAYLAYGATLLTLAITRRYLIYSQLGDGDILAVHADGHVARPLPKQHEFQSSQTASLCTSNAFQIFQVRVEPCRAGAPALITLSTDGYANCFGDEEGFFTVGADLLTYLRSHGIAFVNEHLQEWLSESSRDGSGDDITVGLATRCRSLWQV